MSNSAKLDSYWSKYYSEKSRVDTGDLQRNVGRTKGGVPIQNDVWERTLADISDKLNIDSNSNKSVLEICCGNGQIIGNLNTNSKKLVGVDFSIELLDQLNIKYGGRVRTVLANALDIDDSITGFDVIIIYFAIQHFDEESTVKLLLDSFNRLNPSGILYIGDIPDERRKWKYIKAAEHRINYIERVLTHNPMIGHWYAPEFFCAIGNYLQTEFEIIEQPSYQINSEYRFDFLIKKK